ncbi:ankyrin repeat domain-containing protein [uncultured Acinetobacter sp.]|uniref:ankyrin repeat domain-containing protein n=1 Tax=uncultured Acinetobacter sp. TaxID=165433 RepID=UPI00260D9B2B|nr:ankyrin repeat domain-containing protein [uncultured Acinetobacter sp.]
MNEQTFIPVPEDDEELHLPELVYWASLGNVEEVNKALEHSDVNTTDEEGYSALHAAAENDALEVVKLLVGKGANVAYKAPYSALELAEMAGNHEIVAYLKSL